ncbi:MAG: 3-phosphoshikimate 1-carboxyvinyltransferase [Solirubrobacterales bacterium]
MSVRFDPSGPLRGTLRPPPDKSISHRAALLAAIGEGTTRVDGYLAAADTGATLAAVRELGAGVDELGAANEGLELEIRGAGLRGPGERASGAPVRIDVANAGTLLRLLPGWLAGQGRGRWTLDGDESIRRRPVDRVAEPLSRMGAAVRCREGRLPPLEVEGSELRGISYELPVASAQVKSCVLLAGLLADGETEVVEAVPTRDHTERMLTAAGVQIEVREGTRGRGGAPRRIAIRGGNPLEIAEVSVPGDFSAAAFHLAAALIVPGSEVVLEGVGLNPTRVGLLGILRRMGAPVEVESEEGGAGGEPRGRLVARHGGLRSTRVGAQEVAVAIDELPLVALLGCFAEGETVVAGAGELRHKESDRIAAIVDGLGALGAEIEARPDGFAVRGHDGLRGGRIDSRGDHRIAMLGAVAGLASRDGVAVAGMEAAAVSYPGFEADLRSLSGIG